MDIIPKMYFLVNLTRILFLPVTFGVYRYGICEKTENIAGKLKIMVANFQFVY